MVHESKTAETIERISAALSKQFIFKGIDTGILQQVCLARCCADSSNKQATASVDCWWLSRSCFPCACVLALPGALERDKSWAAAHANLKLSPTALSISAALDPTPLEVH